MSSFIPPREGITLEYLFRPVQGILLQPIVTAGLLFASLNRPVEGQRILSLITQNAVQPKTLNLALKVLLAAGILYRSNKYLSRLALNNYVSDRSWDWGREVVIVTGGSSGIGAEIVRQLSDQSIKVVILDVAPPQSPMAKNTRFYKIDVTSVQEIQEVAAKIRQELGEPTVLINNAGLGYAKTILDESYEEIQRVFEVNTLAHFKLVKEFLPYMIKQNHGHVITVASMASFVSAAANVSYSATKAAALAFHEGLASELKTRYGANKVRTTIVHPFWVRTALTRDLLATKDWNEFTMEPGTVADAIVAQVLKGESAQLILPSRLIPAAGLRGWPSWLQEAVRNTSAHTL